VEVRGFPADEQGRARAGPRGGGAARRGNDQRGALPAARRGPGTCPSGPGKSAIVLALLRFTDSGLGPWLDQLGDGLGTVLAPWDHPVSGAEMQRLGQARAMLTGRPVLLLDEPTSHLDLATADATLMAMLERTGQRAVLWVTHRAAELAAFPDVVDLAVRRHAGSRAAG
jgi:ABC-type multidrug transport system fused ATPase/permease subunit